MYDTNRIKKCRLDRAWSQEQLAEISSLNVRTVQRIENGSQPRFETISAIAAAFDLNVKDLINENEYENEKIAYLKAEKEKFKIKYKIKFYESLFIFLAISLLLFIINIATSSNNYWFIYPVFCFIVCLIIKWLRLFVFSVKIENWRNKKRQNKTKQ